MGARRLRPLVGVFVEIGLAAFARNLDFDIVRCPRNDAGLAAQARASPHIKRFVEDVFFAILLRTQRAQALLHIDVAGRTGTDASAGVPDLRMDLLGRFQDRCPDGNFDRLGSQSHIGSAHEVIYERDGRHSRVFPSVRTADIAVTRGRRLDGLSLAGDRCVRVINAVRVLNRSFNLGDRTTRYSGA